MASLPRFWLVGEQPVGLLRIDRRPDTPVKLPATVGPMDIVGTAATNTGHRKRLARRANVNRLRSRHQRHDIGFIALAEGNILSVGRYDIIVGHLARRVCAFRFAIEVGADQDTLVPVSVDHEQTVACLTILRAGCALQYPHRRSA